MKKLDMTSPNLVSENIEKIATLFPNCVTETENGLAIDFDLLKQELNSEIVEGVKERYRLEWPGKKEAIITANLPTTKTLRPVKEDSVDFENTENIYIEGDNLEVLKVLQESYLGKVKMIYIDPPYNTGKDFVYKDNFTKDSTEFKKETDQIDEAGNRLVANPETAGRYHSNWLSMMYPRLKLARNLLTEDGVIFMSIDDNEADNLIKISKEIFGQNNIEVLIWNKEAEGSSGTLKQTSSTRRVHEYVICIFKNYSQVKFTKVREALKGKENEFQTANLAVNLANEKTNHDNYYTITSPKGKTYIRQWKWNENHINKLIQDDLIYWGSDGNNQPRLIIPTDDRRTTYLLSILNYGGTTSGRKDFENLMGSEIEFSYPKPIVLLRKLIETATNKETNDIILDFFSGSASTAHATLELNKKYGGNRKFIMVQLPEAMDKESEAYKEGYQNICEIGKERIRRAGIKIKEGSKADLDYGFRVYKLDSSNMQDVYYKPQDYNQDQIDAFADNVKADRTPEDLLTQVLLDWGLPLSLKIETKVIDGKNVFAVAENSLYAYFEEGVNETFAKEIAKEKPMRIVFKDTSFADDTAKENVKQLLKQLSPDTEMRVI